MSTIPKFASNKKYWQILNKLVFGDEVSCPRCHKGLHENYCNKYLRRKLCRKKYRPTSYRTSWLYGMKLSPRQLFILLYAGLPDSASNCLAAASSPPCWRVWCK